jgi:hypothetical protein
MGMALGYTAPTLEDIQDELGLTDIEASTFGALICVGAMIGALIGGQLGSLLGYVHLPPHFFLSHLCLFAYLVSVSIISQF